MDNTDKQLQPQIQQEQPKPLIQHAQKCAFCGEYIFNEETQDYNGPDPLYIGWMCHKKCCI